MCINPDVIETRRFNAIAKEFASWVELDWSVVYTWDEDAVNDMRNKVISKFTQLPSDLVQSTCPLFAEYMLKNETRQDWFSIALAVDNTNGWYSPLGLTKIVMWTSK